MKQRIAIGAAFLLILCAGATAADVNCDGKVTVADVIAAIFSGGEATPCGQRGLPETGQRTCWTTGGNVTPCPGTGHDGDTQGGAPLSYTDNGDGTITDDVTGLVWEKLDDNDEGDLHDWDNRYSWNNAVLVKVAALNSPPCFAGHCDWRLPNIKELQSIANFERVAPAPSISNAFDDGCVPGCAADMCSCTHAMPYWSSTSYSYIPVNAWTVDFEHGHSNLASKNSTAYVRAVREGELE